MDLVRTQAEAQKRRAAAQALGILRLDQDQRVRVADRQAGKIIQAELERIAEDRTTLVIAHRLSTVIDADQILVMEGGRIVERGSHRELLQRGEVYGRMWALQQEEEAKEAIEPPVPGRLATV
ncbi:MAG: hypothetical protein ACREXU_16770 [Gammaproteobacteria bacterium]